MPTCPHTPKWLSRLIAKTTRCDCWREPATDALDLILRLDFQHAVVEWMQFTPKSCQCLEEIVSWAECVIMWHQQLNYSVMCVVQCLDTHILPFFLSMSLRRSVSLLHKSSKTIRCSPLFFSKPVRLFISGGALRLLPTGGYNKKGNRHKHVFEILCLRPIDLTKITNTTITDYVYLLATPGKPSNQFCSLPMYSKCLLEWQ